MSIYSLDIIEKPLISAFIVRPLNPILDTSALIRLKMASEYGYGSNPATILTDKVNLLGSGAIPFWRWLEGSCRTPAGLGKIQVRCKK